MTSPKTPKKPTPKTEAATSQRRDAMLKALGKMPPKPRGANNGGE